jgi:exosome complex exonuclease DIS3/RRP44
MVIEISFKLLVDRLAFSVLWEMTPEAKIVNVDFTKSVICSKASLTYAKAQSMMDDKNDSSKLAQGIRLLNKFAKILKKQRDNAGALTLASPSVKFGLNMETLNPTDVSIYQMYETNSLVEEFMLLANITVAKKIYDYFPSTAILRRHQPPNPHRFDTLKKSLSTVNLDINTNSSKELSESLDKCVIEGNDYFNMIVRILTTRCMNEALYFSSSDHSKEDFAHYGLATPIYTHFTSPIRRYPDVLVHRQLGVAIGVYSQSNKLNDKEIMRNCSAISNKRHTAAQHAGRSSIELYSQIYFKNKTVVEDAYVMKMSPNAVYILIPKYGIENVISIEENIPFEYDKVKESMNFKQFNLKVFDKVKAKISVEISKNFRSKSVITIVEPPLEELLKNGGIITTTTEKRKISELEYAQPKNKKMKK